ncbi:MAG: ABC transporter ATP-binding protein, partial [Rubrivivax sp.]
DLIKVYESLSSKLVVERKETEITALFGLLAAALVVAAAALGLWWFGRVS